MLACHYRIGGGRNSTLGVFGVSLSCSRAPFAGVAARHREEEIDVTSERAQAERSLQRSSREVQSGTWG